MDSLINPNKVPFNIASFPSFNLGLLSENPLDFPFPDLISVDHISQVIHKKLQGDIDLDDAFDFFTSKPRRGPTFTSKLLTKISPTKTIGKRAKSSISMQKRLPCLAKNKRFKNALGPTKGQTIQRPFALKSSLTLSHPPVENFQPFPSLASILGDDESLSNDEDEPPIQQSPLNESQPSMKLLDINFDQTKNELHDLDLCAPFINWGNQSIFEKLICSADLSQTKDKLSKRAECNPYGLDGAFFPYNCQDLHSEKLGNYDLALEEDTASDSFISQCDVKLGEERNLNLHNHTPVHL